MDNQPIKTPGTPHPDGTEEIDANLEASRNGNEDSTDEIPEHREGYGPYLARIRAQREAEGYPFPIQGGNRRGDGRPAMVSPLHPLPIPRSVLASLRGSGVVVAVSGGGDSVGLLRVLHSCSSEFNLRLSVAHLDHGTRGDEGLGDAHFVEGLAGILGLDFDLGHWRATRAGHFEADARTARYSWLLEVARARGCRFVAVGQTLDDQAETILHRIVRGTGLRGLAGMPARRRIGDGVTLVRPLLGVTRAEIRGYLATIGQGFREDSTNQDTSRTRARIRLELLPELADKNEPKPRRGARQAGPNRLGREPDARTTGPRTLDGNPDRNQSGSRRSRPARVEKTNPIRASRSPPARLERRVLARAYHERHPMAKAGESGLVQTLDRRRRHRRADGGNLDPLASLGLDPPFPKRTHRVNLATAGPTGVIAELARFSTPRKSAMNGWIWIV